MSSVGIESIYVSDISLPAGVRTEVDLEEAIASGVVTRSTLEAMRAAEAAEAAAEGEGEEAGAADAAGDSDGGESDGDDS